MMKPAIVVALVLGLTPAAAEDDLRKLVAGLPQDGAAVATRLAMCRHFAGEEPYDKARAGEIARAIKQNKCESLDGDDAAVRKRYANAPKIIKALEDARNF